MRSVALRIVCILFALVSTTAIAATGPALTLEVDARDVTQGIQHAHLAIPVHAGSISLAYPKWIPGEHAATGPVTQLVALQITGGGRVLAWRRDSLDAFEFHVVVPAGVSVLDVRFDYLSPPKSFGGGYGETPNVTPHLLILPFNHFILYPSDADAETLQIKAQVLIPDGWKFDDALRPESVENGRISLPQTSLEKLIDSPLLVGKFFKTIPLTEGAGSTRLSVAADAAGDLAVSEEVIAGLRRVVAEATGLLGPGHYREYVWLVSLGNTLDVQDGLEHHESTDIRDSESFFTDPQRLIEGRTLPHEYVHSWNGKYRRPQGLVTRNYQQPMVTDLLWVYEGMTRYLGDFMLRARSGLSTPEQTRAYVAWIASLMDGDRPGRAWRSLADTATALPAYNEAPDEWAAIRRKRDYYDEMLLVWLEADTLIRQRTNDKRSFDDFCREFFGGPAGAPSMKPYSRADLVQALQAVAPLDWEGFLRSRVDAINVRAPLAGIQAGGWSLQYDDEPNVFLAAREKVDESDNLSLSLGLWVKSDGVVVDVVNGSAAFAAGVAPMMRLVAIDGHKWNIAAARDAIVRAEKTTQPIELTVEAADNVRALHLDYHAGLRNPHLVRNTQQPDLLDEIIAPKFAQAR
jgi:predicted metalloprotease with PDZ domain